MRVGATLLLLGEPLAELAEGLHLLLVPAVPNLGHRREVGRDLSNLVVRRLRLALKVADDVGDRLSHHIKQNREQVLRDRHANARSVTEVGPELEATAIATVLDSSPSSSTAIALSVFRCFGSGKVLQGETHFPTPPFLLMAATVT